MIISGPRSLVTMVWIAAVAASCGEAQRREQATQPTAAAEPSAAERAQVLAEASAAIQPFKKRLSEALTDAMSKAGPEAAIEVCSRDAPRFAAEASKPTLTVGRSSLKLRNPNNAARPWLAPVLTELDALPSAEGSQRIVKLDEQHFGYAEAITLKPLCATCHGTHVAPDLTAKIREHYPNDQATGYEPGQLRGVFWAEVTLAKR